MKFRVYSSIKNIADYQQNIPIPCYPNAQNGNDVALEVDPEDVIILSNQSTLYIRKKPSKKQKIVNFFKKSSK